jgi:Zn-dependent protease
VDRPASAPLTFEGSSLTLGSVLGIRVRVHWLWLVIPLFFLGQPLLLACLGVGLVCVFLHELGHSLVARHYGIDVLEITFWPLGGMAKMAAVPEDAKIETAIALAGPLVNLGLATVSGVAYLIAAIVGLELLATAAWIFTVINALLGGGNLIPAFPMDGGRVLRAQLARRTDWLTATEKAVKVGRVVAVVLVIATLPLGYCFVPLIALFIWFAGAQELFAVRQRHGWSPFGFPFDLGGAGGWPRPGTSPFGAQEPRAAESTPAPPPGQPPPGQPPAGEHDPRRPNVWGSPDVHHRGGFTDDDVREMERYHGRLGDEPRQDS